MLIHKLLAKQLVGAQAFAGSTPTGSRSSNKFIDLTGSDDDDDAGARKTVSGSVLQVTSASRLDKGKRREQPRLRVPSSPSSVVSRVAQGHPPLLFYFMCCILSTDPCLCPHCAETFNRKSSHCFSPTFIISILTHCCLLISRPLSLDLLQAQQTEDWQIWNKSLSILPIALGIL